MINITLATQDNAQLLEEIASPIWQQHYTPIIGAEQVEYMLNKFQSAGAILEQMSNGIDYYLVDKNKDHAGYFSLDSKKGSLFISKFYLNMKYRGLGIAHIMLNKIESIALNKNFSRLELTVNKNNPAYQAYLKLGFKNLKPIQTDIGEGFIMDDYLMYKML